MIRTLFRTQASYTQQAYSKFRVSRSPSQSIIFFFENSISVKSLINNINQHFSADGRKILAASKFLPQFIGFPVPPQAQKSLQEIGSQMALPLLMSAELYLYEAVGDRFQRCLGIQCEQFNPSNNRNIPEKIADCIIQLNSEWLQATTVADLINQKITSQSQNMQSINETQQMKNNLSKIHRQLVQLNRVSSQNHSGKPSRIFTIRMLALMSINWAFLFGVTYGKYGWDVGEPISYLTALGVDLIAMAGIFNLEEELQRKMFEEQKRWEELLNLDAQKRMHKWLYSYYRRQVY